MRLGFFITLLFTTSVLYAETGHSGPMDQSFQNSNSMMGGMGGGGGGGGGSSYQSHASQIQQSFQQPLKDAQNTVNQASQATGKAIQTAQQSAMDAIAANTAKDTPIDEKTAAAVATPPPLDLSAMDNAANAVVKEYQNLSQSTANGILKAGDAILQAEGIPVATPSRPSIASQLQGASGMSRGGSYVTTIDSTKSPAAAASASTGVVTGPGPTTFQRGLLHNPPSGVKIQ